MQNANNALVEAAIENTLSRDGTSPNTMSADLDMNSNKIVNLVDGTNNQDAITLAQLRDASIYNFEAAITTADEDIIGAWTFGSSLRLLTDINTATPPTTEAVVGRYEIYDADNSDILFSVGFEGNQSLRMKNFMRGGNFELTHVDAGGTARYLFTADPDAASELYHIGSRVLSTHADGISIYDPGNSVYLAMFNAGARVSYLQQTTASLRLTSEVHGGTVVLQGEDNAGVLRPIFIGDPDATAFVYHAGTIRLGTLTNGISIRGDITTATPPTTEAITTKIDLYDADGTDVVGQLGFLASNSMYVYNQMHGGDIRLAGQDDATGAFKLVFAGDPDGAATIYHNGNAKLSSTATGVSVTGDVTVTTGVNMADSQLDRPRLKDYSIESPSEYAPSGTTQTLSYVDGPAFEIDLESVTGTTTITLSNAPATGNYGQIVVKITQDSAVARTLVWAGGTFRWAGGAAHVMNPTLNGFSIYTFETWDGGTVWYAGGANYS